ncbi:spondin domain-containing protein [Shewanella corallii]|uniref:Spondin domain-containing protein n=1 Tax=Shewanella corallii TaxID=560080 RepID=A0ABT0NCA0_9GAMM|nr:spondin domain-containing protein [Shewanella corallii]MCL2915412.1 spondin domain-containing protein [Shewanella corallii]
MKKSLSALLVVSAMTTAPAIANDYYHGNKQYQVTVTNLTKGISFTPLFAATHRSGVGLFTLGEPASYEMSRVAEGGDISGLMSQWNANRRVHMTTNTEGLLGPGESVTFTISGKSRFNRLSMTSMLLPTNDTLAALRGVEMPKWGSKTYRFKAFDGGSETNDELCANIPGPQCGGEPFSDDDPGEGYVYPSPGIHGEADLSRAAYQWQGTIGKVKITRIR